MLGTGRLFGGGEVAEAGPLEVETGGRRVVAEVAQQPHLGTPVVILVGRQGPSQQDLRHHGGRSVRLGGGAWRRP